MTRSGTLKKCGLLIAAIAVLSHGTFSAERPVPPLPESKFSPEDRNAIAAYHAQYAVYKAARDAYERKAEAYWDLIGKKRAERRRKRADGKKIELADYVLDQPPAYSGPSRPAPPPALARIPPPKKKKPPVRPMPVVADFLRQAKIHFNFVPEKPASEIDYKRAYAREALAAGLSKEQAVRIYGFEAGGNGQYDVQAGLETKSKTAKPISTALGYNQLLIANTLGLLVEHGEEFIETLNERAKDAKGERHKKLTQKIAALRRMVKYAHSFPNRWSVHVRVARSAKGWGLHALNLDIDIGPLLQTYKLLDSVIFAQRNGYGAKLSAAELEMMNLTGDGSGFDMVTIPRDRRDKVPTSNFFERGGYDRNPVAIRNNVVASLLAATERKMDHHVGLDGAKDMAMAFEDVAKVPSPEKSGLAHGAAR